jgi:hypothetical protein
LPTLSPGPRKDYQLRGTTAHGRLQWRQCLQAQLDPPGAAAASSGAGQGAAPQRTQADAAAEADAAIKLLQSGAERAEKQGWLYKQGHVRRNWTRRWFVLLPRGRGLLLYFKSRPRFALQDHRCGPIAPGCRRRTH